MWFEKVYPSLRLSGKRGIEETEAGSVEYRELTKLSELVKESLGCIA